MTGPRYPYVVVDVEPDGADEAGALLFELGAAGVERRDGTTLARGGGDRTTLLASFEFEEAARAAVGSLPAAWSPRVEAVVGDAWRDEWKQYFEPFQICDSVVVRPPWRDYEPAAGEQVVVLEPGRAFGTGLHETTRLIAQTLADHAAEVRGQVVLDVGCGSGVLALVALALGASTARAVDVDRDAVAVTRENASRNGVSERISADDTAVDALPQQYRVVVANIDASTLVRLAPALAARVAPLGLLVLSGLLAPQVAPKQVDDVREAYAGLSVEGVRVLGEWAAVVLRGTPRGAPVIFPG